MIKTIPYKFKDGRIGFKTYSDKIYKLQEIYTGDGNKEMKEIPFFIKKAISPNEIYEEAIDIIPYEYVELTEFEMEKEIEKMYGRVDV